MFYKLLLLLSLSVAFIFSTQMYAQKTINGAKKIQAKLVRLQRNIDIADVLKKVIVGGDLILAFKAFYLIDKFLYEGHSCSDALMSGICINGFLFSLAALDLAQNFKESTQEEIQELQEELATLGVSPA